MADKRELEKLIRLMDGESGVFGLPGGGSIWFEGGFPTQIRSGPGILGTAVQEAEVVLGYPVVPNGEAVLLSSGQWVVPVVMVNAPIDIATMVRVRDEWTAQILNGHKDPADWLTAVLAGVRALRLSPIRVIPLGLSLECTVANVIREAKRLGIPDDTIRKALGLTP